MSEKIEVTKLTISTYSKYLKIGKWLMMLSALFWFLETWHFGWNLNPINSAERTGDIIANYVFFIGVGIYLTPMLIWYDKIFGEKEE